MTVSSHRLSLLLILILCAVSNAHASIDALRANSQPALGDRLSGYVLPVEAREGNINLNALKANIWSVKDTQRLLLQGDILVQITGWNFQAEKAVIWINRVPSEKGLVNQIVMFLPEVWHRTSEAGRGPQGRNLLVVATARGKVKLNIALLNEGTPPPSSLLDNAESRLAAYLQDLQSGPPALAGIPQVLGQAEAPQYVPVPGGTLPAARLPEGTLKTAPRPWLRRPGGAISFSAKTVKLDPGPEENILVVDGSVVLDYRPGAAGSNLRLSAERAVVFMEPGSVQDLASRSLDANDVRGVYLEGAVQAESDKDDYVIRAPRMYYDFQTDRAIMIDAVLRTYDRKRNLPVFARAKELRQIAMNQWSGKQVTISSSSFATPTLAIGARSIVVNQEPSGVNETEQLERSELMIDSRGTTLEAGGFPMLWWPRYVGPVHTIPLRGVRAGWDEYEGAIAETTWDIYALMGTPPPSGWDMTLDINGYTERGMGLGYDFTIENDENSMALDLYGMKDSGTQRTDTGLSMDVPKEYRYAALWEQTLNLGSQWTFQGQASYLSDSTFISAWRGEEFQNRREYETSLYLKRESRNTAFTALGKYALNNFLSNSWLIGSLGYQVNKLPEVTYQRFGDSLLGDWLTWSSDYRASRMQIVIPDGTPANSGLRDSTFRNANGTPLGPNEPINQAARYAGLRQGWVNRVSTRQRVAMPMQWGNFNITPFTMGQVIGYFNDETVTSDDSKYQWYGSAGISMNTVLQRVHDDVSNSFFDLHRLRHLIEPYVTLWYGSASYDVDTVPLYDPLVDQLSTGGTVRAGIKNTLQTHRGGPGRWYEVDWLTLDVAVVYSTESATQRFPTPQYFAWEPGYSQFGNFIEGSYTWQFSDSLAILGEGIFDLDESRFARASTGIELNHTPRFSTFAEYRFIDVTETKLLSFGGNYEISDKYNVSLVPQWDFEADDFRSISARITRSLPDFDIQVYFGYDKVRGETRVGAQLGQVNY